jgi:integrase/recombinase XerD
MVELLRTSLPLDQWPIEDRDALARAFSAGDLFDDDGLARRWAAATRRKHTWAFGRALRFLSVRHPAIHGFGRFEPKLIQGFVELLREQQLASRTIWNYVGGVHGALRVMWPSADWTWFLPIINRLHGLVVPARPVGSQTVSSRKLFERGIAEALKADQDSLLSPVRRATRSRDGVMLAVQAACALRVKNLSMMQEVAHLERTSQGYVVHFAAKEMKGRRAHELPLPEQLTPLVDRYMAVHRAVLLRGRQSNAVWITQDRTDLSYFGVGRRLKIVTKRWIGIAIPTHHFRNCLATTLAREMPAKSALASAILAHRSYSVTEGYIVHGKQIDASRAMNRHLAELRRKLLSIHEELGPPEIAR